MEQEVIEDIDSTTDEQENEGESTETTTVEEGTPKKAREYTAYEKQLFARNKVLEAKLKEADGEKSNDFGYDVKAYLKASGLKANEFDFVKAEMKASGTKDIDALLENEYFQAKLEKHREISRTEDAIPKGKRTGGVATDSVDYWLSKPIEEVPADKRRAVVNAKLEREKNQGKFYNS